MAKPRLDLNKLMGITSEGRSSEPLILPNEDFSEKKMEQPPVPQAASNASLLQKKKKTKANVDLESVNNIVRVKKNLFCREDHVRYIDILAAHRKKNPGSIVDAALERYFSDPHILEELRLAFQEEQQKRNLDKMALDSRMQNL